MIVPAAFAPRVIDTVRPPSVWASGTWIVSVARPVSRTSPASSSSYCPRSIPIGTTETGMTATPVTVSAAPANCSRSIDVTSPSSASASWRARIDAGSFLRGQRLTACGELSAESCRRRSPSRAGCACQVLAAPALVLGTDVVASDCVASHSSMRAPVQALVAVPVVFGGGDDSGEGEARRREAVDRGGEIHETVVDRDGVSSTARRSRRSRAASPRERVARPRRRCSPRRTRRRGRALRPRSRARAGIAPVAGVDLDQRLEPAPPRFACAPRPRSRAQLDSGDAAAERRSEDHRRPGLAARDVEHAAPRPSRMYSPSRRIFSALVGFWMS